MYSGPVRPLGWLFAALVALWVPTADAVLTIEITKGVSRAHSIAVVPMSWEVAGEQELDIARVVEADLARSGLFAPMDRRDMVSQPSRKEDVDPQDWRLLGVELLVIGRVVEDASGRRAIEFRLYDVFRSGEGPGEGARQLLGQRVYVDRGMRHAAHTVADLVYEAITGEPGVFTTQIAYITEQRVEDESRYSLVVADADGENARAALVSPRPIMSPSWSPDGRRIAYVSFENRRAEIFIQDLSSREREKVSSEPGINGAPAFSPDGRRLALALSRGRGNVDIYVKDLETGGLTRLTDNSAIDTEPAWSPDGQRLYFTSDRGGRPQIYSVAARGGSAKRVTFEGRYNARPRVSPDGSRLAMVHQSQEGYRIAVMDLASGVLTELSDGRLDESPSFAPNGRMIIYAAEHQGRNVLSAVSVDARVRQRFQLQDAEVREPVWAPFREGRR